MNRTKPKFQQYEGSHLPKFNEVEWSQRAQNALAKANITTWSQAMAMTPVEAQSIRAAGAKTIREIAGYFFKYGLRPKFMGGVWPFVHAKKRSDMMLLAGPFARNERYALEAAIGLLNGEVEWSVSNDPLDETRLYLWRSMDGWRPVDELPEE